MAIDNATLKDLLPTDANSTAKGFHYLRQLPTILGSERTEPLQFLDLGAGHGASKNVAEQVLGAENVAWHGVDIDDSEEHLSRPEGTPDIDVYDGVNLPYEASSFDVVWCKQVLEHVRHPDAVIAEVARVLRPGGLFLGSVSQLEPYHSRSIFNWTHYGIRTVFADHGLDVRELTPGVDGILLMLRAVFGYRTRLNRLVNVVTPLNQILEALFAPDADPNQSSKSVSLQRIKVAGHIHFHAQKG